MKRGISALLALALLALLGLPAAASAAPANDKFASRIVLPAGFPDGGPVQVPGSNVEATKEGGESLPVFDAAGHSVWFEWEATGDGWVSIGVCDADFPTTLAVLTGTEFENLTSVASGNGDEGPDCPYQQSQFTFFATSGGRYVIAVDGNAFFPPGGTPPVTEGEFELEIKETPVPPNDEFEDATEIAGSISGEPGGDRFFFANASGFNWTASTEHGEPDELISGASVWYSFTAPEEATYRFGRPCCQAASSLDRDLFVGDAVDALTQLPADAGNAEVHLGAGETVRIRVGGPFPEGSESPVVANFDFNVSAVLARRDTETSNAFESWSPPPPPPGDTAAPRTTIAKTVLKRQPPVFVFKFGSSEPGSTFRCRLDGGKFKPCGLSKRFGQATPGLHKLRVVAVDPAGNVDPTPAVGRFRFPPAQR